MNKKNSAPTELAATVLLCCQLHHSEFFDVQELKVTVQNAVDHANDRESRFPIQFKRLDEGGRATFIPTDIVEEIKRAAMVIVELSDLNPNVMLECGQALGLDKPVIFIREAAAEDKHLPFDIAPMRYLPYRRDRLEKLEHDLTQRIKCEIDSLELEDLVPQEDLERILSGHIRVIDTTADYAQTVEDLVHGCERNFYYLGSAGLVTNRGSWIDNCRTALKDISAHRIVDLPTLGQAYENDQDIRSLTEYCVWLARYYTLVHDGVFALHTCRAASAHNSGISLLVFDEREAIISLGRLKSGFNQKAIYLALERAVRPVHEYVRTLALMSREIHSSEFGSYFQLTEAGDQVPEIIANHAWDETEKLRDACSEYVRKQL